MSNERWYTDENILARVRDGFISFIYGEQALNAGTYPHDEYNQIRRMFTDQHAPNAYPNPGEFSSAFKNWFSTGGYVYASLGKSCDLKVTRRFRNPDGSETEISIGGNFQVHSDAMLSRLTEELINRLEVTNSGLQAKMYHGYEVPKFNPAKVLTGENPRQLATDEKIIMATHLEVLYQDKRRLPRIYGEPFTKYGVPIYDEVIRLLGFTPSELEIGKEYPVNRQVVVKMKPDNQNPMKVVSLL